MSRVYMYVNVNPPARDVMQWASSTDSDDALVSPSMSPILMTDGTFVYLSSRRLTTSRDELLPSVCTCHGNEQTKDSSSHPVIPQSTHIWSSSDPLEDATRSHPGRAGHRSDPCVHAHLDNKH